MGLPDSVWSSKGPPPDQRVGRKKIEGAESGALGARPPEGHPGRAEKRPERKGKEKEDKRRMLAGREPNKKREGGSGPSSPGNPSIS